MAQVQVKRAASGRILARRTDGQPLTLKDREEARRFAEVEAALPPQAWVVDREYSENGELRGVLICSAVLEDHLWVVCDRTFEPMDGLAIYYDGEMPLLRGKSLEELRKIHEVKLEFPGCRIVQEGAEGKGR